MFEPELQEIERLRDAGYPEKALKIAQESIFRVYNQHSFSDEYRTAWNKAEELTTLPVTFNAEEIRATVVNDLSTAEDFGDRVWLLQIGSGITTFFYLVAARTEQDALDAYADNEHASRLTLQQTDDMDEEDCIRLGNAGDLHYFEGMRLEVVNRPAQDSPFVRDVDLTSTPRP